MSALERLLPEIGGIARAAGAAILEIYAGSFAVMEKEDRSPLTAADLAAHRIILDGLAELTPDWPVLSEESATEIAVSERRAWSRYWLVDPLDGTREFVKRNGEFTVNIALIEGDAPVLGVVLAPVAGELFAACRGAGAYVERRAHAIPEALATRAAASPLRVAGSRSHGSEATAAALAPLGPLHTMPLGSSLKFCVIARGEADLYLRLGPTCEWDTAAAQCVLEEAGGAVLDLDGQPLRYNCKDSLVNSSFLAAGDPAVDWLARIDTGH